MIRAHASYQLAAPASFPISGGRGPPSPQQWESVRPVIRELYYNQKLPLKDVKEYLERHHGFRATPRMFKSRLKDWEFLKNAKKDDWGALAVLYDRERRAGKRTIAFNVRGRRRTLKDLQKYIRSLNLSDEQFLAQQEEDIDIPDYIQALPEGEDARESPSSSSATLDICTPPSAEEASIGKPSPINSPLSPRPRSAHSTGAVSSSSIFYSTQNSIFSENNPANPVNMWDDFSPTAVCDQLQRDVEVMGYQIISPMPLPTRLGSEDIDSWRLVDSIQSPGSNPGTPNIEIYCARCRQPASLHFASLEALAPSTPPRTPERRSILNPSQDASESSPNGSTSWQVAPSTRYNDGAWKWPSRCFLACIALRRGDSQASDHILRDAATEFEKMLQNDDPLLLTAAQLVAVILGMHNQGDISRRIMTSAYQVVQRLRPEGHPVRMQIEYLMVSADPEGLHSSTITSEVIRDTRDQLATQYGPMHPYTIQARYSYGWILKYYGDFEASEVESKQTYQVSCSVFKPEHMQSIFALATLAGVQLLLGKTTEALRNYQTVIRDASSTLGVSHPYTLEAMRRLAGLIKDEESKESSEEEFVPSQRVEELYRDVLKGRVKTLGRCHEYTLGAKIDYEEVCRARKCWAEHEEDVRSFFGEDFKVKRERSASTSSDDADFQEAF